ncbi:DUF5686 and carboxypeptidase regulatory-like domain-containing protein [uncultured Dokdonia sp.]|uniref:DUF5686 and carboxypeptidase regulatory-like domain-containing protein n=1 Tax=uncultured Dokdonia sp. TaxID=575653 RepID=UPI002638B790|nr:DUF5686 and carboxypeptidase regulatory-like domain-containing protein [uncultured Dokdonia sp.]
MTKTTLTILFSFFVSILSAQIVGTVRDDKGESLPFVNIYLEGSQEGTTTNGDGEYVLDVLGSGAGRNATEQTYTVVFQFLGYTTVRKDITTKNSQYTLDVVLVPETTSLDEVVVEAGVNPADRVVRAAIENRKANLERLSEYTANFYSRGLWQVKNAPEKFLGQEVGDLGGGLDSTRTGIIYLSETISEIAYQRPNNFSEKIIASKVSGDDNGFSFNTAIDANFSFYENTLEINTQLISPIGINAFSYYKYKLIGTFYEEGKIINKIEVTPRRPKDRVFSGLIYIVEDEWQLYGVDLATNGDAIQVPIIENLNFKQNYKYDAQYKQWVKISQVIDFSFGILGLKGDGRFTAGYSDYNFEPNFTKKSFTNEVLSFADEANKKDSLYWEEKRPVPLTLEETDDYLKKDSIQVIRKSKKYLDSIDGRSNKFRILDPITGYSYTNTYKRWRVGYDGIFNSVGYNTVQGWNGETGLNYFTWSDDDYSKTLYAFAKVNYGFSEDRLRYRAGFTRQFDQKKRAVLSVIGGVETKQFNANNPITNSVNTVASLYFERNYLKIYERSFVDVAYSQEIFNGLRLWGSVSYEDRKGLANTTDQTFYPKDDIVFTSNNPRDPQNLFPDDPTGVVDHAIVKTQLSARINFGQKYYNYPTGKFNIPNDRFPTLFLTYEGGLGADEDRFNYTQLRASLRQGFNIGNKGRFRYALNGGTFLNSADGASFIDFQHFNGNQTRINLDGSSLNRFNLLPYYERSTNQGYFEGHVEHNFKGWVLGKIPGLNTLNFNLVAGAHVLSTADNRPYTEWSIGLDNLGWGKFRFLRVDYVRSSGLGANDGAFVFGVSF